MYQASVAKAGTEPREPKTVETAEHAAGLLLPLLLANGWPEGVEKATAVLVSGEPLEFRGFVYQVTTALCRYSLTHQANGVPATVIVPMGSALGDVPCCDECADLYQRFKGEEG